MPPRTLAQQVYEQIRTSIITGEFGAGHKLVELDIADQMGTSQSTVREALQALQRDGLVERKPHRGSYVTGSTLDEIYDLFQIRSLIETSAVRRAMAHITPAESQELAHLMAQMLRAGEQNDMLTLVQHDMEFHRRLCEWSESTVLLHTWLPLYSQIQRFVVQTHREHFSDLVELAQTHQPILDAIRDGNTEDAVRVVREHVLLIWSKIDQPTPP